MCERVERAGETEWEWKCGRFWRLLKVKIIDKFITKSAASIKSASKLGHKSN